MVNPKETDPIRFVLHTNESGISAQMQMETNVSCGPFTFGVSINTSIEIRSSAEQLVESDIRNGLPLNSTDLRLAIPGREARHTLQRKGLLYPSKTPAVIISRTVRTMEGSAPSLVRYVSIRSSLPSFQASTVIRHDLPPHVLAIMVASSGLPGAECGGESVAGISVENNVDMGKSTQLLLMLFVGSDAQERSDNFLRHLLPPAGVREAEHKNAPDDAHRLSD
jgi:hypothetical protein